MLARSEQDLDFFGRRALEEARAAAAAKSVAAGAAHRQMAAIYAQRLRDRQFAAEGIDDTLGDLDHHEIVEDADGDVAADEVAQVDARQDRPAAY